MHRTLLNIGREWRPINFHNKMIKFVGQLEEYKRNEFGIKPSFIQWMWIDGLNLGDPNVFALLRDNAQIRDYPQNYNATSWKKVA
jgi:hypothetical protein